MWPYMKNAEFTGCPDAKNIKADWWGVTNYGYNVAYVGGYGDYLEPYITLNPLMTKASAVLGRIKAPADTVLFGDSGYGTPGTDGAPDAIVRYPWLFPPSTDWGACSQARHNGRSVVAFVDGHVVSMKVASFGDADADRLGFGYLSRDGKKNDALYNGTGQP
jgi:prepilin-type processing-associated H-X9-DG protein